MAEQKRDSLFPQQEQAVSIFPAETPNTTISANVEPYEINNLAAMATEASKRLTRGPNAPTDLAKVFRQHFEDLNKGREIPLRNRLSMESRNKELEQMDRMTQDYLSGADREGEIILEDLLNGFNEIASRVETQPGALEENALLTMEEEAAFYLDQASTLDQRIRNGEIESIHGRAYNVSRLDDLMRKIETETADRSWPGWFADTFLVMPTNWFTAYTGLIPGKSFFDYQWLESPASNLSREINEFVSMSPVEFELALPEFEQKLRDQSALFGDNQTLMLDVLNTYRQGGLGPNNLANYYTGSALDALAAPFAKLWATSKILRPSRLKTAMGNRHGAADDAADTLANAADGNPSGTRNPGVDPVDALEDSLPNVVKPADMHVHTVGLGREIIEELSKVWTSVDLLRRATLPRLSQTQLGEAAEKTIAGMVDDLGDETIYEISVIRPNSAPEDITPTIRDPSTPPLDNSPDPDVEAAFQGPPPRPIDPETGLADDTAEITFDDLDSAPSVPESGITYTFNTVTADQAATLNQLERGTPELRVDLDIDGNVIEGQAADVAEDLVGEVNPEAVRLQKLGERHPGDTPSSLQKDIDAEGGNLGYEVLEEGGENPYVIRVYDPDDFETDIVRTRFRTIHDARKTFFTNLADQVPETPTPSAQPLDTPPVRIGKSSEAGPINLSDNLAPGQERRPIFAGDKIIGHVWKGQSGPKGWTKSGWSVKVGARQATARTIKEAEEIANRFSEALHTPRQKIVQESVPGQSFVTFEFKRGGQTHKLNSLEVAQHNPRQTGSAAFWKKTGLEYFETLRLYDDAVALNRIPHVKESWTVTAEELTNLDLETIMRMSGKGEVEAKLLKDAAARQLGEVLYPYRDIAKIKAAREAKKVREAKKAAAKEQKAKAKASNAARPTVKLFNGKFRDLDPLDKEAIDAELTQLSIDRESGIAHVSMFVGKQFGRGGYNSAENAMKAVIRRGWEKENVSIVQDRNSKQFFIQVRDTVKETGFWTPTTKPTDFVGRHWFGTTFSALIKDPMTIVTNNMAGLRMTAVLNRAKMNNSLRPLVKKVNNLSKKEKKVLSQVLERGVRYDNGAGKPQGHWFSDTELDDQYRHFVDRGPSRREMEAYYAYKELSDIEWYIRNNDLYTQLARNGYKTVAVKSERWSFEVKDTNGIEIEQPDFTKIRVLDLDTGKQVKPGREAAEELSKKWKTGQFRMIELQNTDLVKWSGDPVKYIMANKADIQVKLLKKNQLNYVAGGHRDNKFHYFIKQVRKGAFKDGEEYHLSPIVFAGARTMREAQDFADRLENARVIWARNKASWSDPTEEMKEAARQSPIEDETVFQQLWNERKIDHDSRIQVTIDESDPVIDGAGIDWTGGMSSTEQYMYNKGRLYYAKRGSIELKDVDGTVADYVDPWTTLNKSLASAVRTKTLGDYNTRFMEEWVKVAVQAGLIRGVDAKRPIAEAFHNPQWVQDPHNINSVLYRQLLANKKVHDSFMNKSPDNMREHASKFRDLAQWLEAPAGSPQSKINQWRDKASGKVLDWQDTNPITAVRAWTFDKFLGFFEPSQLFLQTTQAMLAAGAGGRAGIQFFFDTPWLLHALATKQDNLLDFYATRLRITEHGYASADEFKTMLKSFDNSGWSLVGNTAIELQHASNTLGSSRIWQGVTDVREHGRWFFNQAEKVNRLVAYQLGWKKTKDLNPNMKVGSEEFLREVNLHTSDFNWSMTSASKSGFQEGFMSIPAQFLSWQVRNLELLLPKKFGGNHRISKYERAKLHLTGSLLYGTAATPVLPQLEDPIAKAYEMVTGEPMSPAGWDWMTKGMTDQILSAVLGIETDWASRVGGGEGVVNDIIQSIRDDTSSGVLELLGGATYSTVTDAIGSAGTLVNLYSAIWNGAPPSDALFERTIEELASQLSSTHRAFGAYMIWKEEFVFDSNYNPAIDLRERGSAGAIISEAFGIPLAEVTDFWDTIHDEQVRAKVIKEAATLGAMYAQLSIYANNDEDEQFYRGVLGQIVKQFDGDYAAQKAYYDQVSQIMDNNKETTIPALRRRIQQRDVHRTHPRLNNGVTNGD